MYDNGEGVEKDEFQAFNWYQFISRSFERIIQYDPKRNLPNF